LIPSGPDCKIECEDPCDQQRFGLVDGELLLGLVAALFGNDQAIAQRGPSAIPKAIAGVGGHGPVDMLGVFLALIFIEPGEDRADQIAGRAFADILGDRDHRHVAARKLAAVAFKLKLVAKEAAEAVNDDQIIGPRAITGGGHHRLERRAAIVGRRCAGFAVDVDEIDALCSAMSFDRGDLIGQAGLMVGLADGRHPHIGTGTFGPGCPRLHLSRTARGSAEAARLRSVEPLRPGPAAQRVDRWLWRCHWPPHSH
jgi:hypothetical protein